MSHISFVVIESLPDAPWYLQRFRETFRKNDYVGRPFSRVVRPQFVFVYWNSLLLILKNGAMPEYLSRLPHEAKHIHAIFNIYGHGLLRMCCCMPLLNRLRLFVLSSPDIFGSL